MHLWCVCRSQLWPIREDFTDVKHHAWGSIFGLGSLILALYVRTPPGGSMNTAGAYSNSSLSLKFTVLMSVCPFFLYVYYYTVSNKLNKLNTADTGNAGNGLAETASGTEAAVTTSEGLAAISAAATIAIVLFHFLLSDGHLIFLALCKYNDPEVLHEYHDEYGDPDSIEEKIAYDQKVKGHRESIPKHGVAHRMSKHSSSGHTLAAPLHKWQACVEHCLHNVLHPHLHKNEQVRSCVQ